MACVDERSGRTGRRQPFTRSWKTKSGRLGRNSATLNDDTMNRKPSLTRARILKALREHEDLLRKYSVKRIGLFGSYARGQQKRGSDVDFLVDFETPTYDNFIDLNFSLERLFRRKVGLVTSRSLNPRVKRFVENEVAWHEVR